MNTETPSIRVLHIFPPSLKTRFGGQNITWKHNFNAWSEPAITHLVLDTVTEQAAPAADFFDFEYPPEQHLPGWQERVAWVFDLFRAVRQLRGEYDVLHVHVLWWGSLLLGWWAKARRIPILYESILEGADNPTVVRRERLGGLKLAFYKTYIAILAISPALADDFLANDFQSGQVFTLTNPVDTRLFHPVDAAGKRALRRKIGLPESKTILLFVGSLIHRKGVDLLVEAFLHGLKTDTALHLVLAGARNRNENPSMDMSFIRGIEDTIRIAGADGSVTFTGLVSDRENLADLYRAADLFVFPSRNEGLGNVVLEAMASGLCCVTSALPVLQDVIEHGRTGFIVPVENADALAAQLSQLAGDPDQRSSVGTAARESALREHAFEAWQAALTRIYRKIILS